MSLDDVVADADRHGTTDLVVVHDSTTVVEHVGPLDETTRGVLHGTTADGRPIQDVASAQKSVVAVLVGMAVWRGVLDLDDPVRRHLGDDWDPAVTLRHLLTMTSGLAEDLTVVAPPGARWDYNLGAAYHSTKRVLAAAAGTTLDDLTRDWLTTPLGMDDSAWVPRTWIDGLPEAFRPSFEYPDGTPVEAFVTTGRDLARLGEAIRTASPPIDPAFAAAMGRPSQALNPAYGLLWWSNGGDWALAPKQPERIEGPWFPDVPTDASFALGMGDRMVAVVPSLGLVVVRLGAPAGGAAAAGSSFLRDLLARICSAVTGSAGGPP